MQVRLRCGLSNELNDVDEPSRCEYVDAKDSVSIFPKKFVVRHLLMYLFAIAGTWLYCRLLQFALRRS